VKRAGSTSVSPPTTDLAAAARASIAVPACAWNSTSRPAAGSGRVRSAAGTPGTSSTERSAARSISSSAAAPAAANGAIDRHAAAMSGKSSSPVYLTGRSGTVRSTASAMKASVPSEPMSRWLKIWIGRSKSRNALSEYPIVFFIRYLCRIRETSCGVAAMRSRSVSIPMTRSRSAVRRRRPASYIDVSMTVPDGSTKTSDSSV
jgi:hypothetical protein